MKNSESNSIKTPPDVSGEHTPGPWIAAGKRNRIEALTNPKGGCMVLVSEDSIMGRHFKEQQANANLIASAPDLLHTLQLLVDLLDGVDDGGDGITPEDWQTVREVIRKAKGNV